VQKQIEGAFVQGIGFFLTEEVELGSKGEVISNSTWTYTPPTLDNIPERFYVEMINGVGRDNRILSSKGLRNHSILLIQFQKKSIRVNRNLGEVM
jgi:abscisic-aldehyde oxidase